MVRALLEFARRLAGSLRRSRRDADLEEELRLHLELARDDEARRGHAPAEAARRSRVRAGGVPQAMDALRDQRSLPSLEALGADLVFGWRQLARHRTASVAIVLSLGIAMGATLAAFRLVDVVLLRPLPVADPARLFVLTQSGLDMDNRPDERDDFDYPTYRKYVAVAGPQADVMLVGSAVRRGLVIDGSDAETAVQQFVSGNALSTLGLQPALGRLLGGQDDVVPDGHPVAVIGHHYWQRRFGGDPAVVGRTFRMGGRPYEIVGVLAPGFTGTEPGAITDFYVPSMMNPEALEAPGWSWFRIWIRPKAGVDPGQIQAALQARFAVDQAERVKRFAADTPPARIEAVLRERLQLAHASAGASAAQKTFRQPLWILASLAALLLLIACANVANLLLVRSTSRRIELALRLSIGAARGRLIQLLLIESALLATCACAVGALFAWWAAPAVVSMLASVDRPVHLVLDFDWRTFATGAALTIAVTMLFGLVPAIRASSTTPLQALKETRAVHAHRRLADGLVAAQMALCVFLLLGASLFLGSFERLQRRPLGFTADNLLDVIVNGRARRTPEDWADLAASLDAMPGIESAAVAGWAPLSGNRWRSSVTVPGTPSPADAPNWVGVSPGYFATMGTRIVEGREFRAGDRPPGLRDAAKQPLPGVAVVNETFARVYFQGRSPVGQRVIVDSSGPMEIIGMSADAVYFSVREASHPAVFIPLAPREGATLMLRTAGAGPDVRQLRREISRLRPDVQVRDVVPFGAVVAQQTIRERLLAALSSFFAMLALLLAVIGMYGVLNYAVTRERREIGLRMALGARPRHVLTLITTRVLLMVGGGALVGIAGGVAFGGVVRSVLFEMEPTDPATIAVPLIAVALAAILAVLPPAIRAIRIDPAQAIRIET